MLDTCIGGLRADVQLGADLRVSLDSRCGNSGEVWLNDAGADQGEHHQVSIMTTADLNAAAGRLPDVWAKEPQVTVVGCRDGPKPHYSDPYTVP
jgi:hypothetical protein